jgi:hypothetical protein
MSKAKSSAAALENSHFCRFGCFSERVFQGLVTLVFTKCEKQAPSELSFVKRARAGPNGVDWRALTV